MHLNLFWTQLPPRAAMSFHRKIKDPSFVSTNWLCSSWTAHYSGKQGVTVLSGNSFLLSLKGHELWLIHFHAPFCGYRTSVPICMHTQKSTHTSLILLLFFCTFLHFLSFLCGTSFTYFLLPIMISLHISIFQVNQITDQN